MPSIFDNTFAVELESYLPEGQNHAAIARATSQRLGTPDSCRSESYGHGHRTWWKVVTDGSLNDYARGAELVSPILRGEQGLQQAETVCRTMTDFGCTVNKSCGFHVHVGARGKPLSFFKNLVRLYAAYEPILDSMMPASRRASSQMFARSMTNIDQRKLENATTIDEIIDAYTRLPRHHHERRYFKLNLEAYNRHKTVEFRQHSGTTDATKVRRWTVLCLRMVLAAEHGDLNFGQATATSQVNTARRGSKAWQIGEMMLRPQGVTGAEVCTAMGWPSVSMPAQARMAGLSFTTQRTGREVRYFAVTTQPQTATAQNEISVNGLARLIGAESEELAYMNQRIADLSGTVAWAA